MSLEWYGPATWQIETNNITTVADVTARDALVPSEGDTITVTSISETFRWIAGEWYPITPLTNIPELPNKASLESTDKLPLVDVNGNAFHVLGSDVGGGGGGGAVSSVFGRTGAVTAVAGDYTGAQVNSSAISGQTTVDEALSSLDSNKAPTTHTHTHASLSDVDETGKATNSSMFWNGSVWVPKTPSEQAGIIGLDAHTANTSNPHSVTKAQVGLSNVTNDAQIPASEKGAADGVAELDGSSLLPSAQLPSVPDAKLSSNVPLKDTLGLFTAPQFITPLSATTSGATYAWAVATNNRLILTVDQDVEVSISTTLDAAWNARDLLLILVFSGAGHTVTFANGDFEGTPPTIETANGKVNWLPLAVYGGAAWFLESILTSA